MRRKGSLLIIFIDSLPYKLLTTHVAPFLSSLRNLNPLIPGVGYSINIYYELFAGLRPDDLGFFNKWNINRQGFSGQPIPGAVLKFLDSTRFSPLLSRGLHKVYEKLFGTSNLANIPFSYLKYFVKQDSNQVFHTQDVPTIFNRYALDVILSTDIPGLSSEKGEKDEKAYLMAMEHLKKNKKVFLMLGDLDAIAHRYGMDSPYYLEHIRKLDRMCSELIQCFRNAHGQQGSVIVLSDHGMAPVHSGVAINLEKHFGHIGLNRYVYFLDSVFLRVWTESQSLKQEIENYLQELNVGQILYKAQRKKYGIVSKEFGDIIYLLHEGKVFFPGFMGGRLPKAMHGYAPELESQKGVFIYDGRQPISIPNTLEAVDAHSVIEGALQLDENT